MTLWRRLRGSLLTALIILIITIAVIYVAETFAPPWPEQDAALFLTSVAELLRAVQWPLVALIVAYFFRKDIADLLTRIARWKGLGMELETRDQVNDAVAATALWQASGDVRAQVPSTTQGADGSTPPQQLALEGIEAQSETPETYWSRWYGSNLDRISMAIRRALAGESVGEGLPSPIGDAQRRVMSAVLKSPEIALRVVAGGIANVLELLAAERGLIEKDNHNWTPTTLARLLRVDGVIDHWAEDAIAKFFRAGDAVLAQSHANQDDVLQAIDTGMAILGALSNPFKATFGEEEPTQPAEVPQIPM